jgi:hypothetical protein
MNTVTLLFLALVAAEPTTGITFGNVSFDYDGQAIHNDSVLRLLRGYRFEQVRPWATRVGPDSSAIRSNNQKMKAALLAFQRRRGSLFRKPASYCLADTTSPRHLFGHHYMIISRGRCRLIADEINVVYHSVNAYDIDSLRLISSPLNDIRPLSAPSWAKLPEYVPLELEVFIRGKNWRAVIIQHAGIYR